MPSINHIALALPALFLSASAAPAPYSVKLFSRQTQAPTTAETSYQCFTGKEFPPVWLSWDQLLAINEPAISAQNTPETTQNIISAIQSVSQEAEILPQFILAMVMQESGGALGHVGDKGKSIGLMQVQLHTEAPIQCDPGTCTMDQITGMLRQSIFGHNGVGAPVSPGIKYDLLNYLTPEALRVYNTGHLVDPNNYQAATPCSTSSYVSDIGNRLLGISPDRFPSPDELQTMCGFPVATQC